MITYVSSTLKTITVRRVIVELLMQNRSTSNQERNFSHAANSDSTNKYLSSTHEATCIKAFVKNLWIFKGLEIEEKVRRIVENF